MKKARPILMYSIIISTFISIISVFALHYSHYSSGLAWIAVLVFNTAVIILAAFSLHKKIGNKTILKLCLVVSGVILVYIVLLVALWIIAFMECGIECNMEDASLVVKISTWIGSGWWPQ